MNFERFHLVGGMVGRETLEEMTEDLHRRVQEITAANTPTRRISAVGETELFTEAQKRQIQIDAINEVSGKKL
ncbi:MAG TPA: hypothetical protein VN174_02380 [Candidatus Methanoperedens sp.]|nr:hypothetical protein [Candidatus Methanoperedens sp.]